MHLIRPCGDLERLKLEEFSAEDIPPYAILSHTWGSQEAAFGELATKPASDKQGPTEGIIKIGGACSQASKDGYRYLWADTCCTIQSQLLRQCPTKMAADAAENDGSCHLPNSVRRSLSPY